MTTIKEYRYFAFISYRGADVDIAKKLQKKFCSFKLPSTYINPFDGNNHRMQPVCRDRDNFVGGTITAQIKDAIDHSMYVVMICTPNMTKSLDKENYVNDEVQHLIDTNRIDRLIPLVYDGKAYSPEEYINSNRTIEKPFDDECLPYTLRKWMCQHTEHDYTLNIFNIEEQGERDEEKMFLRCVATILAEEFNKLWDRYKIDQKRHKRILSAMIVSTIAGFVVAIYSAIMLTQPVDVSIRLKESSAHNPYLPQIKNAAVSISADDYVNSDTVTNINKCAILDNVPHRFMGEDIHIKVQSDNWLPLDTIVKLEKQLIINIKRDPKPYGSIKFRLWNVMEEKTFSGVTININGHNVTADKEGRVTYCMPISEQRPFYILKAPMPLRTDTLFMPTTESTIIEVK